MPAGAVAVEIADEDVVVAVAACEGGELGADSRGSAAEAHPRESVAEPLEHRGHRRGVAVRAAAGW